jgi:hypothetical protein
MPEAQSPQQARACMEMAAAGLIAPLGTEDTLGQLLCGAEPHAHMSHPWTVRMKPYKRAPSCPALFLTKCAQLLQVCSYLVTPQCSNGLLVVGR